MPIELRLLINKTEKYLFLSIVVASISLKVSNYSISFVLIAFFFNYPRCKISYSEVDSYRGWLRILKNITADSIFLGGKHFTIVVICVKNNGSEL